jgi:hypothetical protein
MAFKILKSSNRRAISLTETLVVVLIIAVALSIAVPAAKKSLESFDSSVGTAGIISAALKAGRNIAIKEGRYAGVRFQLDQEGRACMVFIVQDDFLANGFRAVQGRSIVKLPEGKAVMDMYVVERIYSGSQIDQMNDYEIDVDNLIDQKEELNDTTTFSIIFSPAGKLTVHTVQMRNKNGYPPPEPSDPDPEISKDDVFNIMQVFENGDAMFLQDDYPNDGYGPEMSRKSFYIYDTQRFNALNETTRYSEYLIDLEPLYVSPYSGEIINKGI